MPALRFLCAALVMGVACPALAQEPAPTEPAEAPVEAQPVEAQPVEARAVEAPDARADVAPAPEDAAPEDAAPEDTAPAPAEESTPAPTHGEITTGGLRVVGSPRRARVFVDDREVGRLPYEGRVAPGVHRLRVEDVHQKTWYGQVDVQAGQLARVRVHLQPETDRGSAWATLVIGALFLGGGITTAVLTNDLSHTLAVERDLGTLSTDDPRLDRGLFMSIGADAGLGLALIFCAISIYYFVYESHPPSEGHVLEAHPIALAPYVDPARGAGGLALAGRF